MTIEKMIEVKVSYDSDRTPALQDCGIWAALALPGETKMGVDDPREMERLASKLPIEQAAIRWLVSDDPEEHVEQIRPYIELGFTHLVFHSPGTTSPGSSTPTPATSSRDCANASAEAARDRRVSRPRR